jgi:hypothetical protein
MRKAFVAAVVLLAGSSAQTQTAKVVGIGASSCARFSNEIAGRPTVERDYFAWAQGFMSGLLMRATQGVDEKLDLAPPWFSLIKQAAFLRDYCSKKPNQGFAEPHRDFWRLRLLRK